MAYEMSGLAFSYFSGSLATLCDEMESQEVIFLIRKYRILFFRLFNAVSDTKTWVFLSLSFLFDLEKQRSEGDWPDLIFTLSDQQMPL